MADNGIALYDAQTNPQKIEHMRKVLLGPREKIYQDAVDKKRCCDSDLCQE